ncbi:Uncharacterized protein Y057_7085 [Fusarium fujikuroi]|nr:Uncharacterized protein Y057_7085 [Fusarium fujikuroi]
MLSPSRGYIPIGSHLLPHSPKLYRLPSFPSFYWTLLGASFFQQSGYYREIRLPRARSTSIDKIATSTVKSIAGAVNVVGHVAISITSPSQHFTKAEHRNFYSMQPKLSTVIISYRDRDILNLHCVLFQTQKEIITSALTCQKASPEADLHDSPLHIYLQGTGFIDSTPYLQDDLDDFHISLKISVGTTIEMDSRDPNLSYKISQSQIYPNYADWCKNKPRTLNVTHLRVLLPSRAKDVMNAELAGQRLRHL